MKKIAVNKCYGGFSLSPKAVKLYEKRKNNREVFFYIQSKYEFRDGKNEYKKCLEYTNDLSWDTTIIDLGDITSELKDTIYYRGIERDDEILINIVEEIGKEASGRCANIQIVEIPDDVEWEIEDYDGVEWISEKHRIWE